MGGNNLWTSFSFLNIPFNFLETNMEKVDRDGTTDVEGFVPPKIIDNASETGKRNGNDLQLGDG